MEREPYSDVKAAIPGGQERQWYRWKSVDMEKTSNAGALLVLMMTVSPVGEPTGNE